MVDVVVLIAFIIAHLTTIGRTEIRITSNLVANAVARPRPTGPSSWRSSICRIRNGSSTGRWTRIRAPTGGRQQPSTSRARRRRPVDHSEFGFYQCSLGRFCAPPAAIPTARLAIAIGGWVGSASAPRPQNAGLDHGRHAPLETLDELGPVLGMAPAILEAIRPHLTLFGPSVPNAATRHPVVAEAFAETSQSSVRSFPEPATFRHADDADCRRRVWPETRA